MSARKIAVLGHAFRVPGVTGDNEFWDAVVNGRDLITRASTNVGATSGSRVHAYGVLDGFESFDEDFFGYSPREAAEIDPQQRLLLECAVEALEASNVRLTGLDHRVGVHVATGLSSYLMNTWSPADTDAEALPALLGGDGHYAATRIAYKLGLTGPAMAVGSACSSSLLAVHTAVRAILAGEADLMLAGGMDVEVPQPMSYIHQSGGILAPDGVCRPFDQSAAGTVFGSGGGVVLLAALDVAESNGWPVRAVILGSAVNNDGAEKASFTAPSTRSQAEVMTRALAEAELDPASVSYFECHGTGTQLGDRSELDALRRAYGSHPGHSRKFYLGSAKANFGHLRVGAGVVGLIKACEVVARGVVPPCANFESPMRGVVALGAEVPVEAIKLEADPSATFAGVSSFGFGGTNVHMVLGGHAGVPATQTEDTADSVNPVTLKVSSSGPDSCVATAAVVAEHLRTTPGLHLADVSHTLAKGRDDLDYRLAVVGRGRAELADRLDGALTGAVEGWSNPGGDVLLLLPGQGSDLTPPARGLYGWEGEFTRVLDDLWARVGELVPAAGTAREALAAGQALPMPLRHALHVAISIAWGDQLRARGITATQIAGHSLGEYAAAALSGALSRTDVLRLVIGRAELLADAPAGTMIVVNADAAVLAGVLPDEDAATVFAPDRRVLAVPQTRAAEVQARLTEADIAFRTLEVGYAYHSVELASVAEEFTALLADVPHAASDRWIATSTVATPDDPDYWAKHLCAPIDFTRVREAAAALGAAGRCHVVDLSPDGHLGRSVTSRTDEAVHHVRLQGEGVDPQAEYLGGLARLWTQGVEVDLQAPVASGAATAFVSLPARSFDRRSHLKEPAERRAPKEGGVPRRKVERERSLERWAYQPSWRMKRRSPEAADHCGQRWLVFADASERSSALLGALRGLGVECVVVVPDSSPAGTGRTALTVTPGDEVSVRELIAGLGLDTEPVDRVVHLWCIDELADGETLEGRLGNVDDELALGFYTLLFAVQELGRVQGARPTHLDIVGRGLHPLHSDSAETIPERSLLAGPALVIPQDFPFMTARTVDVSGLAPEALVTEVVAELRRPADDRTVTFGGGARWVRSYERDVLPSVAPGTRPMRLREQGVYLITGGLGGIGMTLAEYLVRECRARLVLTGLEAVPESGLYRGDGSVTSEDPVLAERAQRIRRLEELGGEVLAVRCDAADVEQSAALFALIDERFGRLDGVVHAAGVFETQRAFRGLDETSREDCLRRLRPKVNGTLVLAEFLRGRQLDFVLMQSSLSSQLGGLGFYAYTAGNAFMDAFAERFRDASIPWMSVNWDGWIFRERGEDPGQGSVVSPSFASPDFGVVAEIAVRPSEGAEIYARLMQLEEPHQVLISTADFERRVEQWVRMNQPRSTGEFDSPGTDAAAVTEGWADRIEARVAQVWHEVLGAESLRPDSDFFALGGDSLLGVTLAYRLGQAFDVVLSVITMFENPTVSAMAGEIRRLESRRELSAGH